jgi:hypothetical protein
MVRVFGPPGPFHAPHNTRTDELVKGVDAALQPQWDGQVAPRDAARGAAEAIAQVLSQPL